MNDQCVMIQTTQGIADHPTTCRDKCWLRPFSASGSHDFALFLEKIELITRGSQHMSQVTVGEAAKDTPLRQPIDVVSRTRFGGGIVLYACMSFDSH